MNKESIIWRDVKNYEGYYQVSNTGLVRSKDRFINYCTGRIDRRKGRPMRPKRRRDGYLMIEFCKNHKKKTFKIHRLVAEAFISNPENKPQVNHMNFCKDCNNVENLEWCTAAENNQHAAKRGHARSRSTSKNNRAIFIPSCGCCYFSIAQAGRELNISYGHLHAMLSGKRQNTLGIEYCK